MRQVFPNYINEIYIMLTEFCPMRCEYCYIKDRDKHEIISEEAIDNVFELFKNKNPKIIFFGGEPLVEFDLMEKMYYKYKDKARFQVVTSALVNFDKMIEFYKQNKDNFELQVSWDGHVDTRKMKGGASKEDIVYESIIAAAKDGNVFQVRSVVNDTNIDELYETYKVFKGLKKEYRITGDFTIAHQKEFMDSFHIKLEEQMNLILKDIECQGELYFPQFMMRYLSSVLAGTQKGSCDAGDYIVLRPNGDIYPCTILSQERTEAFKMGSIFDIKNIDCSTIEDIKARPEKCNTCKSNVICDGGCRYERVEIFNENWSNGICDHTCKINNAIVTLLKEWFEKLNPDKRQQILDEIIEYRNWFSSHFAGDKREDEFAKKWAKVE